MGKEGISNMVDQQVVAELCQFIMENFKVVKRGQSIYIDGMAYTLKKFVSDAIADIFTDSMVQMMSKIARKKEPQFLALLFGELEESLKAEKESILLPETFEIEGVGHDLSDFSLIHDARGEKYIINNNTKRLEKGITPEGYLFKFPYKVREEIQMASMCVRVEYNPRQKKGIFEKEGVPFLNSCVLPDYFYQEKVPVVTTLPKVFKIILEILTGKTPESMHGILCWLKTASFDKTGSALCLFGVPGLGKNNFSTYLKNYFGRYNFTAAPSSIFTSRFNSVLDGKTVAFVDEVSLKTHDANESFKALLNDYFNPEGKGKDADVEKPLCVNFILSNNDPTRQHVDRRDRKKYIPILGRKKVEEVLGDHAAEKINRICYAFDRGFTKYQKALSAELVQLHNFLYHYDVKGFSTYNPPKTEMFNTQVILSLAPWQKTMRSVILAKKQSAYILPSTVLFPRGARSNGIDRGSSPQSDDSVIFWLRDWVEADELPLAKVEKKVIDGVESLYVIPEEKYCPDDEVGEGGDEEMNFDSM